jgi:thiol-disulfide isomerase/thioredoxin
VTLRCLLRAALAAGCVTACSQPARSDLTLLFFERSPTARVGNLTWAPDADHSRIIVFQGTRPLRVLAGRAHNPVAAARLGPNVLVSELTGEGVVLDTAGNLIREWESPHPVALYAASGDRVLAVRSPYRVPAFLSEPRTATLIVVLDTLGHRQEGLGAIHPVPFVTQVANAGAIAAAGDAVYFAPMVRDEIVKYGPGGTVRWTATRHLPPREPGASPLRPPVVNVAMTLGPNGRLYVLGASDSNATRLRVDVLDTATGRVLQTRHFEPEQTAVALSRSDSLFGLNADSLAAGLPAAAPREPFDPPFALVSTTGDTVRSDRDYDGYVRLVNFWASWCDPCREEFPHMAELARDFAGQRFVILAISDDVDRGAMLGFLRRYDPGSLVILEGKGRMKGQYHYRGLPYTLVIDRHERIAERIFGFGGAKEFAKLRETIAKEIAGP